MLYHWPAFSKAGLFFLGRRFSWLEPMLLNQATFLACLQANKNGIA